MFSDDMDGDAANDQTLTCVDCQAPFPFTSGEQEFYASKQLTPPKRCKPCRVIKRQRMNGGQQRDLQRPQHRGYGSHQVPGVHEENVPMNGAADYL